MDNLTAKYRSVFQTDLGKEVLADILTDLGFFEPNDDSNTTVIITKEALRDYGLALLMKCGMNNQKKATEMLLNAYVAEPEINKESE
jgi:hypothetical protein